MVRKVKITGERSIESKLQRLAYELGEDAQRVKADHGSDREGLSNALSQISRQLGALRRSLAS